MIPILLGVLQDGLQGPLGVQGTGGNECCKSMSGVSKWQKGRKRESWIMLTNEWIYGQGVSYTASMR